MTGEISLRGEVLPIGGLKEKSIAAYRSGIKRVIIPEKNVKNLDEVPDEVKQALEFKAVTRIEEVLEEALHIKLPESKKLNLKIEEITSET